MNKLVKIALSLFLTSNFAVSGVFGVMQFLTFDKASEINLSRREQLEVKMLPNIDRTVKASFRVRSGAEIIIGKLDPMAFPMAEVIENDDETFSIQYDDQQGIDLQDEDKRGVDSQDVEQQVIDLQDVSTDRDECHICCSEFEKRKFVEWSCCKKKTCAKCMNDIARKAILEDAINPHIESLYLTFAEAVQMHTGISGFLPDENGKVIFLTRKAADSMISVLNRLGNYKKAVVECSGEYNFSIKYEKVKDVVVTCPFCRGEHNFKVLFNLLIPFNARDFE